MWAHCSSYASAIASSVAGAPAGSWSVPAPQAMRPPAPCAAAQARAAAQERSISTRVAA